MEILRDINDAAAYRINGAVWFLLPTHDSDADWVVRIPFGAEQKYCSRHDPEWIAWSWKDLPGSLRTLLVRTFPEFERR